MGYGWSTFWLTCGERPRLRNIAVFKILYTYRYTRQITSTDTYTVVLSVFFEVAMLKKVYSVVCASSLVED